MNIVKRIICMISLIVAFALLKNIEVQAAGTSFATATQINVNTDVTDNYSAKGESDYYKFTLSSPGYISVTFSHKMVESGIWTNKLYYEDQSLIYEFNSKNYDASLTTCNIGLPAGTYYYRSESYYDSYSAEKYTFRINFNASANWETEKNNTLLSADQINVNEEYFGAIHEKGGRDWYKFSIPSTGYISISFLHQMVEYGIWEISFYSEPDNKLIEIYSRNYDETKTSCNIGLPAGDYYIMISNDSYSSCSDVDYSLKINYVATAGWETEPNNTYMVADSCTVGVPINGSIMPGGDIDRYVLDIPQAGYYSINIIHSAVESGTWELNICDSSEKSIDSFYSRNADTSKTKSFVYLSAGRNYIVVSNTSSENYCDVDYTLTVNPAVIQKVQISKVTKPKKKQLKVTWKKVSGVTGYEISIAKNKKFTKAVKTVNVAVSKSKYTFKKLKSKKTYYVRMRAYVIEDNKYYYGEYSGVKKVKVK